VQGHEASARTGSALFLHKLSLNVAILLPFEQTSRRLSVEEQRWRDEANRADNTELLFKEEQSKVVTSRQKIDFQEEEIKLLKMKISEYEVFFFFFCFPFLSFALLFSHKTRQMPPFLPLYTGGRIQARTGHFTAKYTNIRCTTRTS
jgi:hypothetical protein